MWAIIVGINTGSPFLLFLSFSSSVCRMTEPKSPFLRSPKSIEVRTHHVTRIAPKAAARFGNLLRTWVAVKSLCVNSGGHMIDIFRKVHRYVYNGLI